MKEMIRVANAGGFWGDDPTAFRRQINGGPLDYISIDYLAELTMSILKKKQLKDPKGGYVPDFVDVVVANAEDIRDKGLRILSNAGGMDPYGCAREISQRLAEKHIDLKVAIVEGDDLIGRIDKLYPDLQSFDNMEDASSFSSVQGKILSANIYFGIEPIVKALDMGADIIVCGRVTDTSITIAPMLHEFNWSMDDLDKLASATVAGHIIECGSQVCGGNHTDWQKIEQWTDFAYPVIEMQSDGSFTVTKHEGSGGLISVDTVREQLLYEMGDPAYYISPDVVVDLLDISIGEKEKNRVMISGVKGLPAPPSLKVSMAYEDGYTANGSLILGGEDALQKADKFAEIFWKRLNTDFQKKRHELIGYNSCNAHLNLDYNPHELLLRLSVYDADRRKVEHFSRHLASLILSGPPGAAVTGGRPRVQKVLSYWPTLIDKELTEASVSLLDRRHERIQTLAFPGKKSGNTAALSRVSSSSSSSPLIRDWQSGEDDTELTLRSICLARSGDKGDAANIGVMARNAEIYEYMKEFMTANFIKDVFSNVCKGNVKRYEFDAALALNFILEHSLDGGGTKTLMIDAQGKLFASNLLDVKVRVPRRLPDSLKRID